MRLYNNVATYRCAWCQALLRLNGGQWVVAAPYSPVSERRWAACMHKAADNGLKHAFDGDATLCELPEEEVEVYRHLWRPGRSSCDACARAAAVIDGRWPPAQRA
ncbi:hypothetical protein AB0C29_13495 [Actinoplanes sp. NPDC048791]|uniref:hypothetical protein n=1 Tax=Actinoplanes sp. NPDC048791 TaxID=3154623 RepID=UPI0033CF1297